MNESQYGLWVSPLSLHASDFRPLLLNVNCVLKTSSGSLFFIDLLGATSFWGQPMEGFVL